MITGYYEYWILVIIEEEEKTQIVYRWVQKVKKSKGIFFVTGLVYEWMQMKIEISYN